MDYETLGVTKIEELIAKSDYLVPNINKHDKEPSFDGNIEVYCKPGNTHNKADLIIRGSSAKWSNQNFFKKSFFSANVCNGHFILKSSVLPEI